MNRQCHRFLLAAHLAVSVGWIGAVAAYIALDVVTATSLDAPALRGAYLGMDTIASYVLVPLAISALISGIVIARVTRWGLVRHWWVVMSLLLTAVATLVLLVETRTIAMFANIAADPATSVDGLRALGSTLPHSVGGMAILLVVLVLNVYKPRGLTAYGWRKEREERLLAQRRSTEGQGRLLAS